MKQDKLSLLAACMISMHQTTRLSRILLMLGLVAMVTGMIDPLEGSIAILIGSGLITIGARLAKSRYFKLILLAFILSLIGIGVMWGLSCMGGIGGTTGRSYWWALLLLPYPIGWIIGVIASIRA